jgi:hypothetical protein
LDEEQRAEGTQGTETQGTREGAQETQAQEPEQQGRQGAEPEITIGEDGELNIPDSFWGDAGPEGQEPQEKKEQEAPKPDYYTPEGFAEAYEKGQIDEKRLDPSVLDYYRLVSGVEQRRRDAEELRRRTVESAPPQQQRPAASWDQIWEAGKILAAQYLGISPGEFDEYDERHKAARVMAVNEIRDRSQAAARQEREGRRAWESHVAGVSNVYAEYRQKVPELDEISERFFPAWRRNLTVRQHEAVGQILSRGNETQIRQLFDAVIADYRAFRNPPRKESPAPPPGVMDAKGADGGEPRGVADVSKLGGMSPEEQAEFLISNKFVSL